ncbi:helix-turn-helix domain-containing protein [Paenibacillus methanolicus]|uniref:Helix-turn-helix protein n=1 Tax=Paenibacillus methanolicus TaxID=582686 RepID=A0A5S5CHH1_9BACL|nr:helix-turn-helix domain-containing protein [Paenibacillus methanolicus]TYP78984.1 helix-turn-helix protein [Paenibacillus methanolicus]
MKKIRSLFDFRLKSVSFFLQLVIGFLGIILLLVSLTLYAVSVQKNNVRQEVVKYNTLLLRNTMDSYEKHFKLIEKHMHVFYYSDYVQQLQREPHYTNSPEVIKNIQTWVSNPYLFIDNIVFYSNKHQFVLEKGTTTTPDIMFDVFLASERYPKGFWAEQFEETYNSRVFPADRFYTNLFRSRASELGEYIPIVFKPGRSQDFYMAVFLNAKKMYEAFHQSSNEDLIIFNEQGDTIFSRAGSESAVPLRELKPQGEPYFSRADQYFFYMTGKDSRMTYLHRLPVSDLASQTRLNLTMVMVIVAVVLLSILISFLLAARMNTPLKRLIQSIRGASDSEPYRSHIQEFDLIGSQMSDKKKILKQWAFINYLKDIRNQDSETAKLDFSDKAFVFVLFHVVEKHASSGVRGSFPSWLYYIKVFVEVGFSRSFPEAVTIQIEHNQILSLVFLEDEHHLRKLRDQLDEMKIVFDQDRDSGVITIAMTSTFHHFNQVPTAYKEAHERVGYRRLIDETQIVDTSSVITEALGFSPEQDKEFRANLKAGNAKALTELLERFFAQWRDCPIHAGAWLRFAETEMVRIRQALSYDVMNPSTLDEILANAEEKLQRCVTVHELESLLADWVKRIAEVIQQKKERKDAIISFVMEYVGANLEHDIYLQTLADKLNISSGYLSSYFKEKTGVNLVEYINETRIQKATDLLADSQLKIQDVAEAVGYRNITSFNRMFKKYTGLKPSDFRKNREPRSESM